MVTDYLVSDDLLHFHDVRGCVAIPITPSSCLVPRPFDLTHWHHTLTDGLTARLWPGRHYGDNMPIID